MIVPSRLELGLGESGALFRIVVVGGGEGGGGGRGGSVL